MFSVICFLCLILYLLNNKNKCQKVVDAIHESGGKVDFRVVLYQTHFKWNIVGKIER
jgi:hypothetical protein